MIRAASTRMRSTARSTPLKQRAKLKYRGGNRPASGPRPSVNDRRSIFSLAGTPPNDAPKNEESRLHRRAKNVSRGHSAITEPAFMGRQRAEGPSHKDPRREPGKKRGGGSGERGRGGVETRGVKRGRPRQPWSGPPGRRGAYVGNCGARRVEAGQRGGLRQAAAAWPFGRYRRYPALPWTELN